MSGHFPFYTIQQRNKDGIMRRCGATFTFIPNNKERWYHEKMEGALFLLHQTTKKQRWYHEKMWHFGQEVALVYGGIPLTTIAQNAKISESDLG